MVRGQWRQAGTNLKVGGHRSRATRRKIFFGRAPPLFFGSKSTISRFGERFRVGQYIFVSFLFAVFLLAVPPCPAICKSGAGGWHVPYGVGATVRGVATEWTDMTWPAHLCQRLSWRLLRLVLRRGVGHVWSSTRQFTKYGE